jgi:hypothetical protein
MPRPRTGSIRRKQTTLGIAYGLRFKYRGEEHYHHLGGSWEGWTDERADEERRYVMAQVERGEYVPQRRDAAPPIGVGDVPTFQVLASLVLDRVRRRVASRGADDLEWRLRTAMDHFGPLPVDQIDAATIDDFVDEKLREREAIASAAAAGHPLTESATTGPGTRRTIGAGAAFPTHPSIRHWPGCGESSRRPSDGG